MDITTILTVVGFISTFACLLIYHFYKRTISMTRIKAVIFVDSLVISIFLINTITPKVITIAYGDLTDHEIALYNIDSTITKSIIAEEKKILMFKDTITTIQPEQAYQRNQFLVNSLLQHQAIVANFEKAEKESRNEIRIYYFTILSALMAYIFLKKKHIMLSLVGMMIVIFIMYSLDIHYRDQEQRQHKTAVIVSYTIQELQNISFLESKSYVVDFDIIPNYFKINYASNVERRKIIMLSHPDVVQNRLFIYPLIFVLTLLIYNGIISIDRREKELFYMI